MSAAPQQPLPTSTPVRVLILGDHFGYPGGIKHGVSTYYLAVIPALLRRGLAVEAWFLGGEHEAAADLRSNGVPIRFMNTSRWSVAPLLPLLQRLRSGTIDLLHVSNIRAIALARIAAQLTRTPLIIHLHDAVLPPRPVRALNRLIGPAGSTGICVSAALRPLAQSLYRLPPERVHTLHNGLDLERFRNAPRLTPAERSTLLGVGDGPVIGMIGRLHPVKGHRAMLSMMPAILARHARAVLVIVGDGPIRAECERHATALGIEERVRFLGQREDLPTLLAAMDLTVLPSESEGLGLVAIESLAAGVPVVAHDVGGVSEVVTNGMTGTLVPLGDSAGFIDAVCQLLDDDARRGEFGAAGRADAARFELSQHVEKLLMVYEACRRSGARHHPR